MVLKDTLYAAKKKCNHQPSYKHCDLDDQVDDELVQYCHKICGSNHLLSDWTQCPLNKTEPMSDTARTAMNLRLDRPWTLGKTKYYYSAKDT